MPEDEPTHPTTTTTSGFAELDVRTAYELWRLRADVFVVEQDCVYADLDGRDVEPGTTHVLLHDGDHRATDSTDNTDSTASTGTPGATTALLGCARVLDDGDVWRIGRVVVRRSARGTGLSRVLMDAALGSCGGRPVVLAAQSPLAGWYATFGFEVTGAEFLEDGIPHVPMRRAALSRG